MGMVISSLSAVSTLHPEANPALSGQNIYAVLFNLKIGLKIKEQINS